MAFIDWTTTETNDGLVIHQFFGPHRLGFFDEVDGDPFTLDIPIDGSGSLVWHFINPSSSLQIGTIYRTADGPVTSGWLRTVYNIQSAPDLTGEETYAFGIYCCANTPDLIHGTGECYFVSLFYELGLYKVGLYKLNIGVLPNYPTYLNYSIEQPWGKLIESSSGQWAPNTTFTVELKWLKTANSITLTFSQGMETNPLNIFTDLVTVLEYEDTENLLTTLAPYGAQGFWAYTIIPGSALFMDITQGKITLPFGL